jgi:hypothetical protein
MLNADFQTQPPDLPKGREHRIPAAPPLLVGRPSTSLRFEALEPGSSTPRTQQTAIENGHKKWLIFHSYGDVYQRVIPIYWMMFCSTFHVQYFIIF